MRAPDGEEEEDLCVLLMERESARGGWGQELEAGIAPRLAEAFDTRTKQAIAAAGIPKP